MRFFIFVTPYFCKCATFRYRICSHAQMRFFLQMRFWQMLIISILGQNIATKVVVMAEMTRVVWKSWAHSVIVTHFATEHTIPIVVPIISRIAKD